PTNERRRRSAAADDSLVRQAPYPGKLPLNQCIARIAVVVVLEHRFDWRSDLDPLPGIAEQIADHANVSRVGQLDQHDDIRALVFQGGMNGMPDTLPAIYSAGRLRFDPVDLEGT